MDILFLISARGGSKGVPGKNLQHIEGMSLIGYKARSAQKSKYCSRLILSSDSEDIREEAARYGVEAPFVRPAHLASDDAPQSAVVAHAIDYIETEEGRRYDAVMLLEPSTPFARARDYDGGVELMTRCGANLVVGMREMEVNNVFVGPMDGQGRISEIIEKINGISSINRQDQGKEYTMNGAFYLFRWDFFKSHGKYYVDPVSSFGYLMDHAHSIEIDSPFDLWLARELAGSDYLDLKEWQ